jgi:uncharacterized protein (TIRG00374 family)
MKKRLWLIRLIGIILLIFVVARVDLSSVASTITKVNLWYLALAIALNIPLIFFKSWRWQSLLKMQDVDYGLRQAFPAYLSGIYLGLVTPGRLGEFSRVLYLTNDKELSLGEAFSSVLVDRLCDIYLLVIVSCFGFITFSPAGETILAVIVPLLLIAISILFLSRRLGKRLTGLVYKVKLFERFRRKIDTSVDQFYWGVERITRRKLVFPLLLTLAAYGIYFSQCYLLVLSLNLPLSFFYVAICMAVASLVALIPISISGIGTRDATLIALFSLQNIAAESALSYSLLVLFTFYICGGVMGAVAWQIKPLRTVQQKRSTGEQYKR